MAKKSLKWSTHNELIRENKWTGKQMKLAVSNHKEHLMSNSEVTYGAHTYEHLLKLDSHWRGYFDSHWRGYDVASCHSEQPKGASHE